MSVPPAIVWFSQDLRLGDNPALAGAAGGPIVPVFIWSPEEEAPWSPGAASRWWLRQSLQALDSALGPLGSRLIIRRGPACGALLALAEETGARSVFWNRRYEPAAIARDRNVEKCLREHDIAAQIWPGNVLFEPGTILNRNSKPFQVFTAFWRACLGMREPAEPDPAPTTIPAPGRWPASLTLSDLHLEPRVDWAGGLRETWQPGEQVASRQLSAFLDSGLKTYPADRDRPDRRGTSHLSPHLHFGEISARQVWHAVRASRRSRAAIETYLRQIAWREFSYHLLFHLPHTAQEPLRPEFRDFPWQPDPESFRAWTRGMTGYPLVDAGMRELWRTGWMHNRVRMVAASFLVKHLLMPWQKGAEWFWDTLVDADLANNTMGWQWTAGCGADAAPYFRIFNPALQQQKFDPEGAYVRRWVPELSTSRYPRPIVEHKAARERALAAFSVLGQ